MRVTKSRVILFLLGRNIGGTLLRMALVFALGFALGVQR